MSFLSHILVRIGMVFPICLLSGCGSGDAETYPVQAQVLVNGKPAAGVQVVFHPLDPAQPRVGFGVADHEGRFQLTTLKYADGAAAGKYDITAIWPDHSIPRDECSDPIHDRLKQRYCQRGKSGLNAEIRPGTNLIVLELELEVDASWSAPRKPRAISGP